MLPQLVFCKPGSWLNLVKPLLCDCLLLETAHPCQFFTKLPAYLRLVIRLYNTLYLLEVKTKLLLAYSWDKTVTLRMVLISKVCIGCARVVFFGRLQETEKEEKCCRENLTVLFAALPGQQAFDWGAPANAVQQCVLHMPQPPTVSCSKSKSSSTFVHASSSFLFSALGP